MAARAAARFRLVSGKLMFLSMGSR